MANTSAWDDIATVLATEAAHDAPGAIGINLVELARPGADPVALVERAAAALAATRLTARCAVSASAR